MPKLRLIAVALLAASAVISLGLQSRAEPLDREECQTLEAEKRALFTPQLKAALSGGPDWVKENLHNKDEIEKIREFLTVEEKIKFRCRTDGVVIPEPKIVPLPDRKPDLPPTEVADVEPGADPDADSKSDKVLANAASTSLLPLRKPSLSTPEAGDGDLVDEGAGPEDEITTAAEPDSEPSQTIADSDKTAPSETKATQ